MRVETQDLPGPAETSTFDGRPGLPDGFGRALRDLRISVTDRCNFRCPYCMPAEVFGRDFAFLPRAPVLSFEEIARLAGIFTALGVRKLRITGGEPLVRRDLPVLVGYLAALRTPEGEPIDLTLTTNGSALRALAGSLAAAGLARVTVVARLARRRGRRADERGRLPGVAGARRDRRRARPPAWRRSRSTRSCAAG